MKSKLIILSVTLLFAYSAFAADTEVGKTLFKSNCAACHTVGKGKLTGPDLKDISKRQTLEWIIPFVKNSTAVIESGDEYANKIYQEYNKTPMSLHPHLTDEDITNIVAYIDETSASVDAPEEKTIVDPASASPLTVINEPANSVIDSPMIKTVFWGSVLIIVALFTSLAVTIVKLSNKD